MKILSKGNKKIAKSILCFSLPPVVTCLNHAQCKRSCYARFPYAYYPYTKAAWDRNLELVNNGTFKDLVIAQLKTSKTCKFVRIHVSGDFFNQDYIDAWIEIAKTFPGITFYGYSKVFDILDLTGLIALDNVNIINSIAFDGGVNFGKVDRLNTLKENGYRSCPAIKNKNIHCGLNCFICMKIEKVCFLQHR
jgi:hypothetical protein